MIDKNKISKIINDSIDTKKLLIENCLDEIYNCGLLMAKTLEAGNKLLFCGNGGSAADAQHIAAELVVRFRSEINRPALPAIALTVDASIMTAGGNDIGFENVFARATEAYGKSGDLLIGISTSGNSPNVIKAIEQAKKMNIQTIGLLGNGGGKILPLTDNSVVVPSKVTARIQESHILTGHIWCEIIEEYLFPDLFKE